MTLSVWVQCQVTVLTEAPPVEVKPTVGSEQVAHLKTVNCSCSAGEKVSVECVFFSGMLDGFVNNDTMQVSCKKHHVCEVLGDLVVVSTSQKEPDGVMSIEVMAIFPGVLSLFNSVLIMLIVLKATLENKVVIFIHPNLVHRSSVEQQEILEIKIATLRKISYLLKII